ncbi:MAG TPA: MATE family efflux transporter [Thermoanaerobaculia bacterium]|nr:MATE family efflux transporter [Thermoanaerobaculia bacterium]
MSGHEGESRSRTTVAATAASGRGEAAAAARADRDARSSPADFGVWQLAWPTIVSYATHTLVRWADLMMVGPLGGEALAAVGLGGQAFWLVQSVGMLVPTGLTALLARAVGARDLDRADRVLRHGLWLAAILGAATTICGLPLASFAIRLYGVEPAVVALGADYLTWLLLGNLPFALGLVLAAALRAAGDSRTPLVTAVIANGINVGLNWVLIYGHLGAPALGVRGAAIASTLAMITQVAVLLGWWRRGKLRLRPSRERLRPDRALFGSLFAIGWPAALEGLLFATGILWFQRLVSRYGTEAVAAYNVGAAILSLAFLPGMGFAAAASALVGQHLGDRNPAAAARSGWLATAGALVCMTLVGSVIVAFSRPIAGLFSRDPAVADLVVLFIWILGAVLPLMAVEFALGGALRGAGDTFYPLAVVFTGLFVCRLVPASILALVVAAPIAWVWGALVLDYLARASLVARRFRRGRWRTIQVWEGETPARREDGASDFL